MALNGNYVDLIIIAVFVYFVSGAFRFGFLQLVADAISFLFSLLISLRVYKYTSIFLIKNFNLTKSLSDSLGFMVTSILLEIILGQIAYMLLAKLPKKIRESNVNKLLGIIPAGIEGIIFIAFFLSLIVSLPIRPDIKKAVLDSKIGSVIVKNTSAIEKINNQIFGGVIEDSLNYLTVKPEGRESVNIKSSIDKLTVDADSETKMFALVNDERTKVGVGKLDWNPKIVPVAENYATDMWKRSYFSHYSPEGKDVGDRLNEAHIPFQIAGENLALAPTLSIAHSGLMNSQGHRENILNPEFHKVGIGVIDNGVYGKIFVQVFTN